MVSCNICNVITRLSYWFSYPYVIPYPNGDILPLTVTWAEPLITMMGLFALEIGDSLGMIVPNHGLQLGSPKKHLAVSVGFVVDRFIRCLFICWCLCCSGRNDPPVLHCSRCDRCRQCCRKVHWYCCWRSQSENPKERHLNKSQHGKKWWLMVLCLVLVHGWFIVLYWCWFMMVKNQVAEELEGKAVG